MPGLETTMKGVPAVSAAVQISQPCQTLRDLRKVAQDPLDGLGAFRFLRNVFRDQSQCFQSWLHDVRHVCIWLDRDSKFPRDVFAAGLHQFFGGSDSQGGICVNCRLDTLYLLMHPRTSERHGAVAERLFGAGIGSI